MTRITPSATISEDGTTLVLTGIDHDAIRRLVCGLASYNDEAPGRTDTEAIESALSHALRREQ